MGKITGYYDDLVKRYREGICLLDGCNSKEEKYALYNYLIQVQELMKSYKRKGAKKSIDILGKDSRNFRNYLNSLVMRCEDSFIRFKKFHNEYLGEIIDNTADDLDTIVGIPESDQDGKLDKDDFYCIFYDFLKELDLEKIFDDFIKDGKLFERSNTNEYVGMTLINPITCEVDLICPNFDYSLYDMFTLAHEFGHVYDLGLLRDANLSSEIFNYGYVSMYGEVISRLFEKLFINYLEKKQIMPEVTRDIHINSLFENRDSIVAAQLLSNFSNKELRNESFKDYTTDDIYHMIAEEYEDPDFVKYFLSYHKLDLGEDATYAYGEVLSIFLMDSINNEGMDSPLFQKFLKERTKVFTPKLIEKSHLEPKIYQKLFQREIDTCKK